MGTAASVDAFFSKATNTRLLAEREQRSSTSSEFAAIISQMNTLRDAAQAGRTFFTKLNGFHNANTHHSASTVWLPEARTQLQSARTQLSGLGTAGDGLLAQAQSELSQLQAAEDAVTTCETAARASGTAVATILANERAASAAIATVSTLFANAAPRLTTRVDAARDAAVAAIESQIAPKMGSVRAGTLDGLVAADQAFLTERLDALQQLGQPPHPMAVRVGFIERAVRCESTISRLSGLSPVTGAGIGALMDLLDADQFTTVRTHFASLGTTFDTVCTSRLQPELKAHLTRELPAVGASADLATAGSADRLAGLVTDAQRQADQGRIAIDLALEQTRVQEVRVCEQINADYTGLGLLEQLSSEMWAAAAEDERLLFSAIRRLQDGVSTAGRDVAEGVRAIPAAVDGVIGGQGTISGEQKDQAVVEATEAAGALASFVSLSGWAERLVDSIVDGPNDEGEMEERAVSSRRQIQAGHSIQAAANSYSVVSSLASLVGIPDPISPFINGTGKFLQKKGEGYDVSEALAYATAETVSGFIMNLPFLSLLNLIGGAADASGSAAALAQMEQERRILEGDEVQADVEVSALQAIDRRWGEVRFEPMSGFEERLRTTNERLLEIREKLRVNGLRATS